LRTHGDEVDLVEVAGLQFFRELPFIEDRGGTVASRSLRSALQFFRELPFIEDRPTSPSPPRLRPPQVVTKRPCEQGLFFASYRRECVEVVID